MLHELDTRTNDGLFVSLVYDTNLKTVDLIVNDTKTDLSTTITVPNSKALDAFYHPFAYLHSAKAL